MSKKKFGGAAEDYLLIHEFLDSSKLFYFNIKHRALLHNTYGIDLCIKKFGHTITNSENKVILTRDVAAEHCKEDLFGVVPTLSNWFKHTDNNLDTLITPVKTSNDELQRFIIEPFLMSGLKSSLIITHSNFGVHLVKNFLNNDLAVELANQLNGNANINELLQHVKLKEKWQFTPDLKQLNEI